MSTTVPRRSPARWLPWIALGVLVAAVLVVGARGGSGGPESLDHRVERIARDVRCPQCSGQSAADSDAETAVAVRATIRQQVQQGRTDGQIKQYLADRYGQDILERPPATGIASLVWVLPVIALVLAVAGLIFAFRRWKAQAVGGHPTPEDRRLVDESRGG